MPEATLPIWYVAQWMPNGGILEYQLSSGPVQTHNGTVSFSLPGSLASVTITGPCTVLQHPVQSQIDYIRQQAINKPST